MTPLRVTIKPDGTSYRWDVSVPAGPGRWLRFHYDNDFGNRYAGTARTERTARKYARRALGRAATIMALDAFDAGYAAGCCATVTIGDR